LVRNFVLEVVVCDHGGIMVELGKMAFVYIIFILYASLGVLDWRRGRH
jgi:hypothetical protein